jgi:hypothetical protein
MQTVPRAATTSLLALLVSPAIHAAAMAASASVECLAAPKSLPDGQVLANLRAVKYGRHLIPEGYSVCAAFSGRQEAGILLAYADIFRKEGRRAYEAAVRADGKCPAMHFRAVNGQYAVDMDGQRVPEPEDPCGFGVVGPQTISFIAALRGPHPAKGEAGQLEVVPGSLPGSTIVEFKPGHPGPEGRIEIVSAEPPFDVLERVYLGQRFRVRVRAGASDPKGVARRVRVRTTSTGDMLEVDVLPTADRDVLLSAPILLEPALDGDGLVEP